MARRGKGAPIAAPPCGAPWNKQKQPPRGSIQGSARWPSTNPFSLMPGEADKIAASHDRHARLVVPELFLITSRKILRAVLKYYDPEKTSDWEHGFIDSMKDKLRAFKEVKKRIAISPRERNRLILIYFKLRPEKVPKGWIPPSKDDKYMTHSD